MHNFVCERKKLRSFDRVGGGSRLDKSCPFYKSAKAAAAPRRAVRVLATAKDSWAALPD